MPLIIWKKVKTRGFQNRYLISNYGDILSLKSQKILSGHKVANGGLLITLTKNDRRKNIMIHKLVWQHFKKSQLGTNLIMHKDYNKENNHSPNLNKLKRGDYLRLWNEYKNKIRGVYKYKQNIDGKIYTKYRAVLKVKNKTKTLGYYKTKEEAILGYFEGYLKIYKRPPFELR